MKHPDLRVLWAETRPWPTTPTGHLGARAPGREPAGRTLANQAMESPSLVERP